jgi:YVTN family beta-propeller protein
MSSRLIGLVIGALGLLALVVAALVAGITGGGKTAALPTTAPRPARRARRVWATRPAAAPSRLVERETGTLPAPVQDPAPAAVAGGRMLLLGGLTVADTSSAEVLRATARAASVIGQLPSARHDTAAAALGGKVYLFGGGTGVSQLDDILRVDPRTGSSTLVGRLPAASSDSAAAAIGGTAYVVGGYTGTRWLDTIVAWRPGAPAHVVSRLPAALRYAAVTAVGGRLVIAGGSLADGTASADVLEFIPASRRLIRIGRLPAPTTHAAAASLDGVAYVIGGRGAALDTPTARIVSVDPRTRRVRAAGSLKVARSDLAAAGTGGRILVTGGHAATGTVATLSELVPARHTATARTAATTDVYAHDGRGMLAAATRGDLQRIYVPNSLSDTVDVIDPHTDRIVEHFAVGGLPQHVVPAWNLKTLYVTNDTGNSLTPIDPRTAKPGKPIQVADPYNMYFTPDGRYAIVVAERLHRLDFRDARTFKLHHSLPVPCSGIDHMDFSAGGTYLLASCEFSGQMVKVDLRTERVTGVLDLPDGASGMPQDVKLSPDGKVFYVADMMADGLWEIDGRRLKVIGFLPTGRGVHGLYPSRDARYLYATNRGDGTISVISFRTRKAVAKWRIPGGGSPDMGGVSADGRVLWLSGRYNGVVYAISTRDGHLLAKIPVGSGPHGLCVWPQPGRYSLGHTGILR